jgi:ATP-dependent helicase HepA
MVHYDLPFSPNRIEQRIGRVDRYGRGDSVGSIALLEHDSPLIQAWCNCLDSAFRVFDRSIASLQLLIEDRMKEIFSKILFERASIIDRATLELAGPDGEIERELKRIALQDALDSMENSNVEDDGIYDRLSELETHWKELKTASEGWIVSQLQFRVRPENETQDSGVIRYKYRLGHKGENTLVPIQDLLGRFAHAIDRSAPGFDAQNIYTHAYTYKRVTAQSRGVRLARLGDYFFDAMMDYVRWDDRGTCFALWRFLPNHNLETPAELAFRFDFLVETEMEPSYRCLVDGENVTKESIQRKADYLFPPIIRSVWIDEEMNVIVDEERVAILGRPYRPSDQQYFQDGWVDFNLKAERWKLIEHWYDASSCCSLCQEARRVAETIFYNDINLTGLIEQRADRCSIEASIHLAQMKSRLVYADGAQRRHEEEQLRQEEALLMALLEGIKSPHVRLDSLGAIFLSTINPFKSEDSR